MTMTLLVAATARAADRPPSTRYGLVFGARAPTGALASRYGIGGVVGMEAGFTPSWYGFVWSLQYARFWSSDPRNVDDLQLVNLDFVIRARLAMRGDLPAFLWGEAGASFVRSNTPIDPAMSQTYVGPTGGIGTELIFGPFVVSLGADYTFLSDGPSGLRVMLFGGVGGR
jgi:hypothetical protein